MDTEHTLNQVFLFNFIRVYSIHFFFFFYYQSSSEKENHGDVNVPLADTGTVYILEYSTVIEFLGACPTNREEMNMTVVYVPLEPYRNKCFGNFFIQYLQDTFLGYDDVLLHSIRSLNEKVETKGYLR